MAMNWLKGLVAPAPQYGAQNVPPGSYGVSPPQQQPMPFGLAPQGGTPPAAAVPGAMEWSVGTRTQGAANAGGAQGLDARNAQLQQDVESLALFARTLLTMLEDKKVVTRAEFEETKKRLDMLDGKLDDR